MDRQELIKSYKTFYHVTNEVNVENILVNGLIPNRYPDNNYHPNCPEKKAQVCITAICKLKDHLSSFQQNNPEEKFAIFEIPAEFIAMSDFGFDWTFSGTESVAKMEEVVGLKISIENLGTLACFDRIPKDKLTVTNFKFS